MSVRVTGIKREILRVQAAINADRNKVKKVAYGVAVDFERQTRNRAPVHEGTLRGTIVAGVQDYGRGNGMKIACTAGDTPYARRMHESHYRAHDPHDVGPDYKGKDKLSVIVRKRQGGIKVSQKTFKRTIQGYWRDSAGNLHGRKYLERAFNENKRKWINALEAAGDK